MTAAEIAARPAGTLRGMAFMAAAAIVISTLNAIARHAGETLHPRQTAFFFLAFGLASLLPMLVRDRFAPLRSRRVGLLSLRVVFDLVSMLLFLTALLVTPLAKATALHFTTPLFATILAVLILGERLRLVRVGALAGGFAGTLLILRPDAHGLDAGGLMVLGSAFLWASAMIVVKVLSRTESGTTITVYMCIIGTPVMGLAAWPVWQTPSWPLLGLLAAAGVMFSTAQILVARAFQAADASAVVPMDFLRLLWAAVLGYFLFAEIPDTWTWIGGAVIFAAVLGVSLGERPARASATPPGGSRL